MSYRIKCQVSGGITGSRTAWMKDIKGSIWEHDNKEDAEEMAAWANNLANTIYSQATFRYTVVEKDAMI